MLVTFLVKAGFYVTILAQLTSILHSSNSISLGKVGYILSNLAHLWTESLRLLCAVGAGRLALYIKGLCPD